jgi:LPXTG-motif cell wall-anchored protein
MDTAWVFVSKSMKEGIMDRNRFDDLTRAMAAGASRRDLLKGVLGGVAAGAAVTVMPEMVGAQETCIEPGDECVMEEGAVACCGSYTCFEALCDNARGCWEVEDACDENYPCCDETMTCVDGTCAVADDGADDDDAVGGTAETLPSTGIGDSGSSSGWLGAVAAGGAVAAAATVLRRNREQPEEEIS